MHGFSLKLNAFRLFRGQATLFLLLQINVFQVYTLPQKSYIFPLTSSHIPNFTLPKVFLGTYALLAILEVSFSFCLSPPFFVWWKKESENRAVCCPRTKKERQGTLTTYSNSRKTERQTIWPLSTTKQDVLYFSMCVCE